MPQCTPDTLVIDRPTVAAAQSGSPNLQCPPSGVFDCVDKSLLGPRKNRQKVIEQLKDAVLLELGAPVIDVELDDQQLTYCVELALQKFEYYAPREFFDYYTFVTNSGQSVYKLPESVGYVRHVAYREMGEFAFQASDLDGAIPIEYFYPGGSYASIQGGLIDPLQPIWGRVGEWSQFKSTMQMYSRYSSGIGGWEWVSDYGYIKLYPVPCRPQHVIVHYIQKNKDWKCTSFVMIEGALAKAKQIVGQMRSKFQNLPGPGGNTLLNGAQILQEGREEWKEWEIRLRDTFGDLLPISYGNIRVEILIILSALAILLGLLAF